MSYEQRLESALRTSAYRMPVDPVRLRPQEGATVTGLEKSAALSSLDQVRGSASISGDRSGEIRVASTDSDNQDKLPALSFSDLIDVINPLQHIPLVSNVYRAITGDEISGPAQVAGDALYFGPIGAAASVANLVIKEVSGWSVGDEVASLLVGSDPDIESVKPNGPLESSQPGQPSSANTVQTAALSPAVETLVSGSEALSPDQPFSFGGTTPPIVPEAPRAIGFASSPEPITLESLPADILAALYSGQPVRSAGQSLDKEGANAPPASEKRPDTVGQASPADVAPRWSLWSSPDDTLATPAAATRAYGGVMPDDVSVLGGVASQGGWFGANMPEILARYQNSINLQQQAAKPFVDVSQ